MQSLKQAGFGLIVAMISLTLVLGGAALALAENNVARPATPTATGTPVILIPSATQPPSGGLPVVDTLPPPPTNTLAPADTLIPPTSCPAPSGWVQYQIKPGDTLPNLAASYRTTAEELVHANCLGSVTLISGSYIFIPPVAAPTPTACRPPAGWVRYTIRPGDNLYQISLMYGITVLQLQQANCMATNNTTIVAGKTLFVPPWATVTVPATPTPIPSNTPTPTATPTQPLPPTATDTPSPTATLEPTATFTPTPTSTTGP